MGSDGSIEYAASLSKDFPLEMNSNNNISNDSYSQAAEQVILPEDKKAVKKNGAILSIPLAVINGSGAYQPGISQDIK